MILVACLGSIANGALQPIILIIFTNITDLFTDFSRSCLFESNSTTIDYFVNMSNQSSNSSSFTSESLIDRMKPQAIYLIRMLNPMPIFVYQ